MNLTDLQALKCKTCGEPLDLGKANDGVIKCAVCDSCFTLPKLNTDQKVLSFLMQGEHDLDTAKFEEAYAAYSKAAELDKTEPEAYWGMALAESKIQYLKDEVNNRLQPICHEINDKVFSDGANFLKAIRYASNAQRDEYEKKGEEIDRVKKEFYRIKQTGLEYDCFICVKVTDEHGGRTADYKTADDIYFELKGKGYKPFFSERELGNVTGADYEARILYALYSSECMLVVCFDEAYLRTKWVKNEYTRFLKLVNDEEKESDSIALVFKDKPIEKLPGKHGKIQGVSLNSLTAMERIVSFVDSHTPEARKRREEQAKQKDGENEALKKKLAELEDRLRNQPQATLSDEEIYERFERARQEKERKEREEKEAAERAKQEEERKERTKKEAEERAKKKAEEARLKTEKERQEKALIARDFEIENGVLKKYKGTSKEVVIPDGVTSIGDCAFLCCSKLERITIPNSVTSIGYSAFDSCSGLKSIELPDSVTSIGDFAFQNCSGLMSVKIPHRVKSFGRYAFYECTGLTKIEIPSSVTDIGESAFANCTSLKEIHFSGDKKQWRAVKKDKNWDSKAGKYKLTFRYIPKRYKNVKKMVNIK